MGVETIRRYRRAPRRLLPTPGGAPGPAIARRPNHVGLIDVTHVPSLFNRIPFRIVAILDACSRLPVAARLLTCDPRARDVVRLLSHAVSRYDAPHVLVSDRAKIFRSKTLGHTVRRFHIQHRFGAVGQPGSIVLIERFWRTLKTLIDAEQPTLFIDRLERRLATALFYYSVHRRRDTRTSERPPPDLGLISQPLRSGCLPAPFTRRDPCTSCNSSRVTRCPALLCTLFGV